MFERNCMHINIWKQTNELFLDDNTVASQGQLLLLPEDSLDAFRRQHCSFPETALLLPEDNTDASQR